MSYDDVPDPLLVFSDSGGRLEIYAKGGVIRLEVGEDDDGEGGEAYLDFDHEAAQRLHKELTAYLLGDGAPFHLQVGQREGIQGQADGGLGMKLTCFVCDDLSEDAEPYSVGLTEAEALEMFAQWTTTMIRERIEFA